jgi:hypothetical protein
MTRVISMRFHQDYCIITLFLRGPQANISAHVIKVNNFKCFCILNLLVTTEM